MTGTGVTRDEICEHLFAKRPGPQEYAISNDTIHRLFVPPWQATSAAKYYKSLIDAKVPGKSNRYQENHPDQHFLFSRIGVRDELGQLFKKHAQIYSCDDMNKINVGVNAVSRYHEIDRFFTTSNSPEYSDHDFPYPGYKIIVSGYMALENKGRDSGYLY